MKTISRLAWATAATTLMLLTLGGAVHATGSSLACPDWPLCHGQLMPEMIGGVAVEHSHRLLGTLVGLLTLAIAACAWRERTRDPFLARAGLVLVVLVVVQGVLGGITVLVQLSLIASELHLLISMVFLSLLVIVAVRAGVVERGSALAAEPDRRLSSWTGAALVAVVIQVLLGGLVRHSGAAMACSTDPLLCNGTLMPSFALGQIQMLHRIAAVLVTLLVVAASLRVARTATRPAARWLGFAAILLVAVQVTLGVLSVTTVLDVAVVTAHLTVAALLVLDLVGLHMLARGVPLPAAAAGTEGKVVLTA